MIFKEKSPNMYNRSKNNFYNKDNQQKANYGKFTSSQIQKGDNNNILNNNLYKKSDILSSKIIGINSSQKILLKNDDRINFNFEEKEKDNNNKSKLKSNKNNVIVSTNSLKEEKLNLANEVLKKEIELLKAELSLANSVYIFIKNIIINY